jgi:hypothetical protein
MAVFPFLVRCADGARPKTKPVFCLTTVDMALNTILDGFQTLSSGPTSLPFLLMPFQDRKLMAYPVGDEPFVGAADDFHLKLLIFAFRFDVSTIHHLVGISILVIVSSITPMQLCVRLNICSPPTFAFGAGFSWRNREQHTPARSCSIEVVVG